MENKKLLEAVADISYIAGYRQHYSGDSRIDMRNYVLWAQEFEELHRETDWGFENYMILVEEFSIKKLTDDLKA